MKLLGTTIRNVGALESVELDLSTLTPEQRIVAVVGENGSGKSTILEAMTGAALFRDFRTHGSLSAMSVGRESMILTGIEHSGQAWSIKHLVRGKEGESVLANSTGSACNPDAKKTSFDACVAQYLPPEKLLYATVWHAQLEHGLLEAKDSERQELILMATGATHYEALAKQCREAARAKQSEANGIRSQIASTPVADIEELCADIVGIQERIDMATADVNSANNELTIARAAHGDTALARAEYERHQKQWDDLVALRLAKTKEANEITARIVELNKLDSLAIRSAAATVKLNDDKLIDLREELATKQSELRAAENNLTGYQRELDSLGRRAAPLRDIANPVSSGAIIVASERLPEALAARGSAERFIDQTKSEIEDLQRFMIASKVVRIEGLRHGLDEVRKLVDYEFRDPRDCNCCECCDVAENTIKEDDKLGIEEQHAPDKLQTLKSTLASHEDALDNARSEVHRLELLAAKADELKRAQTELEELRVRSEAIKANIVENTKTVEVLSGEVAILTSEGKRLRQVTDTLRATAAKLPELDRAEATLAELTPLVVRIETEISDLSAKLMTMVTPTAPEQGPNLDHLERVLSSAQGALSSATAAMGAAEERKRQAIDAAERVARLRGDLEALERDQADWTRLALDLGRDGIQAALVDAAGPELTETANHLLHTHFGSRFTVQVSTQRQSADGKKTIEQCEVMVYDAGDATHDPSEHEGSTFSGGEKGIIGEALSLALTHLARNAGITDPDLVRDESGANLDPDKRVAWINMLRGASELIGCEHVYLVSHFEDVNAMADARILVANRTATLQ